MSIRNPPTLIRVIPPEIPVGAYSTRLLRPRYVRIAPGIVQFLTFGPGRRKPRIRSYPLDSGTIVIAQPPMRYSFFRDGKRDELTFLADRDWRKHMTERIWQSLRSTHRIPPLSDDALIG